MTDSSTDGLSRFFQDNTPGDYQFELIVASITFSYRGSETVIVLLPDVAPELVKVTMENCKLKAGAFSATAAYLWQAGQ